MQKADLMHICASTDYFPKSIARPISNSSLKQLAWIFYLPSSLTGSCAQIYTAVSRLKVQLSYCQADCCWTGVETVTIATDAR